MIAAMLANIRRGEVGRGGAKDGSIDLSFAADLLNVGKASVKRARAVHDHGSQSVREAIDRGLVTVKDAASVADLPPEEQGHPPRRRQGGQAEDPETGRPPAAPKARAIGSGRWRRSLCRLFVTDVADLADRLEPGSIDCIITDPPYPHEFLPVYADLAHTAAKVLKPHTWSWPGNRTCPRSPGRR